MFKSCGESFAFEYDEQNNIIYKITHHFIVQVQNLIFKIYDSNDQEINLVNKTFFNNGFTKMQMILILDIIFMISTD